MASVSERPAFWYSITPRGIEQSTYPLKVRLSFLGRDLSIVRYIIYSELKARVFDKSLGWLWLLVEPLILSILYWFVTTVLFSVAPEGKQQFLSIMVALIFFRLTSHMIDRSPTIITSYGPVIRQTIFPVHLLLLVFVFGELVQFLLSFLVLLVFLACFGIFPGWTMLALPIVLLPQMIMNGCLASGFAIIGTFFKDLVGMLYAFTSIWWYLSPGVYSLDLIQARAPQLMWAFKLNPFFYFMSAYRDILMENRLPDLWPFLVMTVLFVGPFWLVLKLFFYCRYYYFKFL